VADGELMVRVRAVLVRTDGPGFPVMLANGARGRAQACWGIGEGAAGR
jgi:hypothetical protein